MTLYFAVILGWITEGIVTKFVIVGNDIVAWLHRGRNMLAGASISGNVDF